MSSSTIYSQHGNIAVIKLNNPPVNSLGAKLRKDLQKGYLQALDANDIKAIIITSNSGIFCGGADINEFGNDLAFADPYLPDLLNTMEESTKPIIAAINGMALGGGLELALACDYRFASASAKLGLPEVKLGLLPGGGGTQRLPRLVGAAKATEMIVSGSPISARDGHQHGLIDQLHDDDGDFLEAAIAYAQSLIESGASTKSCKQISVDTSNLPENFFAEFRSKIAKSTKGFFAPERCIQAIEAAIKYPLAEGLDKEVDLFIECMNTPQARAQQHLFFADRARSKIPGIDRSTQARDIASIAVIGSGTMGAGICVNFLNAGIPVTMLDIDEEALQNGLENVRKIYDSAARKGKISAEKIDQAFKLLHCTTKYEELSSVDLVIEAVFEKLDVKKRVFESLDQHCKAGCILATNTSYLDVNEIANVTQRPEDVIGLHFFSPANIMRLLEVVKADKTSPEVLATALKVAQTIKKIAVVVGVCYGFVGNRMLEPYAREGMRLILEGATPTQIDKALTNFGMAMGFCSVADLAGIDVSYFDRMSRKDQLSHDPSYGAIGNKLFELNRLGQKTGRGFYTYENRNQQADDEVETLASSIAKELGITRRDIDDKEIVERMIFSLINEGAALLDESIAYRASDCDVIWTNGYGFPVWRGGPMQYANEIGLDTVLNGLNHYRQQLGEYGDMWFKPSALLERLATNQQKFDQA